MKSFSDHSDRTLIGIFVALLLTPALLFFLYWLFDSVFFLILIPVAVIAIIVLPAILPYFNDK